MGYTGKGLVEQYGGYDNIPDDVLYDFLCQEDARADLIRLLSPYNEQLTQAAEAKEKPQKEIFLKHAAERLETFKQIPLVASVRKRCKSSLTWLVCYFCWETNPFSNGQPITENKLTPQSHGPILNFFVKKDDTKKLKDQDTRKIRLLLWPRNGMKSTTDVADAVQWVLNFPEVRILFFTGDDDLAVKFVTETKGHFLKKQPPTLMNLFFPEFCVEPNKLGNQFEFNCPVWEEKALLRGEPTVQASSIGSGLGGRHYDVIKADDSVYDKNSENSETCIKAAKKISLTIRPGKMLMQKGYLDIVGTRYHEDDYYGGLIEKNVGDLNITRDKCWTQTENKTTNQLFLIAQGIVIKPEVIEKLQKEGRPVTYKEAGEAGCDLLLPDIMPYSFLMGEYADNEETFESQINQNPRSATSTTFERSLLLSSTVPFGEVPYSGPISITWDFAGPFNQQKKGDRDFSTAAVVLWGKEGKGYVQEIVRNRFSPSALSKAVVQLAAKYEPFIIGIEDTAGSRFLEDQIELEAAKTGNQRVLEVCRKNRIDWIPQDNQKGAKKLRIAALHPWLTHGRLKFANYCMALVGSMDILYDEFERCLHSPRHDDIPDVIAQQVRYAARVMAMLAKPETATISLVSKEDIWRNIIFEEADAFGRPGMAIPPPPIVSPEPEPELGTKEFIPGVPNFLGGNW